MSEKITHKKRESSQRNGEMMILRSNDAAFVVGFLWVRISHMIKAGTDQQRT